ncbi:uncharacterized protein C8orf76 homolog [Gadus morhua]|uniref:Chromosome 8 open reading frame 76 n=1 Tax=Gadus morhua TaxID=8049 RepID=A0A8C4Z9M8_GADMO|nr:uncharacterized protein C8orf76 homolog [Gadus morhua]
MEIFGSAFDDSMFGESKDKVSVSLLPYKAKLCESQWFCQSSALDTEDSLEKQKVFKFRGDLACRQRNYKEALEAYKSCLEWVPDTNLTIRRDVWEGMARCYSNLGQGERALEVADLLSKEASNSCHLTSLLLLKVSIHHHSGAIGAKTGSLEQLCSLIPYNPWHWYNLGQTCLQQLEATASLGPCSLKERAAGAEPDGSGTEEGQRGEGRDGGGEDRAWLEACVCFIRTRLLLRMLRPQQSSFVLQRSECALCRSDEALERLNPTEETLQTLTAVLSEDLATEKMREDSQDGESLVSVGELSFRECWWNKVLESQRTGGDQYRPAVDGCQATTDLEG